MERKWWTLIVVCVATFMLLLDITIVNVALPTIATKLKASFSEIQWVIDAYALTLASMLLTAGSLADLLGRRLVFSIGLGLFALTSLLCGLSPSALFLIVLAIIRGNAEGWGSTLIVALFAAAAVLLVVFLISQFVQDNAMFDVSLFRKPTFDGGAIVAFTLSSSMFAMFLYLTLYMQTILGLSPLQTGLRFLPTTVVMFFVSAISGNLSARVPVRLLLGGGLLLVGLGLMLMRGLTVSSTWTALLAGFIVAGVGVGLVNPALAATAIGVVQPQRSGMASGINSTFRQVGIATGIAVLGAIFESQITSKLAPS